MNPTSDKNVDKKKEDIESVSCSSSVSSTSTGATTHAVEEIFDKTTSSSTVTTSDVTTNIENNNNNSSSNEPTEINLLKSCEFSEDSGFISGPQPTTIDDEISTDVSVKFDDKDLKNQTQLVAESACAFDSGCIDECIEEEEEQEQEEKIEKINENKLQETSNTTETPMFLEKSVESGISEWFCRINLNDQQQNTSGNTMNNLGAASSNKNKKQKSSSSSKDATTNPSQNRNTDSESKINYSDAWQKFFQQNEDGDTPLHLACISGYIDIIAMLIRMAPHPCLLNIQNDAVQTAMHLAAITRQPKILRMLIIAGAESCIRDHRGNTALHLACMSGDLQCVRALTIPISSSELNEAHRLIGHWSNNKTNSTLNCPEMMPSDLELRNYDGERCVHIAAYKGHIDVLRHLINYGVDINAKEGKSGRTALHIAVETSNDTLANFLLEECSQINLETETYSGLTAYQFACVLQNTKMRNCLENYGAEPLTPPDSDYDSSDIETDLDDSQVSLSMVV